MRLLKRFVSGPALTATPPRVPRGLRIYAIGDIHGRLDLLQAMDALLREDRDAYPVARAVCIYLGDLIDRGPDSFGVIEYFLSPPDDGLERRFLRGNHEEVALNVFDDAGAFASWHDFGGLETLHSYGVNLRSLVADADGSLAHAAWRTKLPRDHLAFLRGLESMLVVGDYCFVHAGVRPGVGIGDQASRDLMWIRDPFLGWRGDFGKVIVHGHTPVDEPERHPNRINVDTGAYLSSRLTAVALEGDSVRFLSVKHR